MPAIIDMLMPASGDPYADMAAAELEPYHQPFADAGLVIRPRPWDMALDESLDRADATLALFAWGYHTQVDRWLDLLNRWPGERLLLNPPVLLAWNTRKTYLAELAAKGIAIVPSLFGNADADSIAAAFDHFGVDILVVKPQISAGSYHTSRVTRGERIEALPAAIIQPFVASVGDEGEWSIFFIGGAFSHAARKVAKAGEFRVQPQFGGIFTPLDPPHEALAIAQAVLAALPHAPLYVRIDLLRLADGTLALIEVEAIEPDLYPDIDPGIPARLATAIHQAIGKGSAQ
jgi:glutathione synthase/RimK-type ligase-like ATP-grasp enzyme